MSATGWLLLGLLIGLILDRAIFERPDGIYTGLANNLGDLPFHIGVITRFAWGENYPPEHPSYAGVPFTYPFVADFIAAVFVRTGAGLRGAMTIENVLSRLRSLVCSTVGPLNLRAIVSPPA